MHRRPAPLSPLQALAAKWQALGLIAALFARHITLAEKMRAEAGIHKADILEAWLYAALVALSSDIAAASAGHRKLNSDDADALAYLKTAHALLSVLALLVAGIKRKLSAHSERWATLMGAPSAFAPHRQDAPVFSSGFLDSG